MNRAQAAQFFVNAAGEARASGIRNHCVEDILKAMCRGADRVSIATRDYRLAYYRRPDGLESLEVLKCR